MDKALAFLNNKWLVGTVVALFLLSVVKSFSRR